MSDIRVVIVSQDSPQENKKVMAKQKLKFPILSDPDLEAASQFGIVFKIDEETNAIYRKYNIDLEKLYGRAKPLMPTPAVFVLNGEGRVAFHYVNPDYKVRLNPEVLKAVLSHGL